MGGVPKYVEQIKMKIMKFTDEEFAFLSQHEERFHTAVHGDWARNPGSVILRQIHQLWNKKTCSNETLRESCAHCILRLLKEVGTAYFADKEERENKKAQELHSEATKEPKEEKVATATPQPKKAVKAKKTASKKK